MFSFDAVVAQVNTRLDSKDKLYQPPKGWDASDPKGCWTHDRAKQSGELYDYCQGFKMFEDFYAALAYADTLDYSVLTLDIVVDRWTVTPLDAFYG